MTYIGRFSTKSAIQHPVTSFIHNVWGKPLGVRSICGALAKSRGELLIHTVGIDLSCDGLGDGDHSSELSLSIEGILICDAERCHRPALDIAITTQ